ncbi:MAG: chemotaxis protein CheA [Nevskiaceae bacterium]|nr:MAG: chemotaxis protein CheA [Nevskiaceae bacterium]
MSQPVDDSILADFLTEAGELLERLGSQLVELEKRPADPELLNAIFRAFHTVKGGAGFLSFAPMVDLCHAAEDVFNALRSGKRGVDATLMDAVLSAADHLQAMLAQVANSDAPAAAPPTLVETLHALAKAKPAAPAPAATPAPAQPAGDTISEDEFEALLDELHGAGKGPGAPSPAAAGSKDTITEAEFDALLDQLHGTGKAPGATVKAEPVAAALPAAPAAAPAAAKAAAETTVRVDTQRLDRMMNLVGELVLARNRLKTLRRGHDPAALSRTVGELDHITRRLQDAVMQIRMQPIAKVFSRFPKVARDVARGLGKQVEVELQGEDTDLDKNLVEALADPLVHMVRNAVDHGIELPEVRVKAGKPAAGKLTLAARQEGDHILITVSDDGAGMDPDRLRSKVVEKGLMDGATAARLSAEECLQLVFLPGFSTKEQISDLSGRGVGMDVVKSAITRLSGDVSIRSRVGQGSVVRIEVPLTLAIMPALMVTLGARVFAMPLASVLDVFVLDESKVRALDRWDVIMLRGQALRLVHLDRWAGEPAASTQPRHVVEVQCGGDRYGLVVHQVRGREEVVIKPLGAMLKGLAGLAGATVTGEGRVALILDVPGLVQAYGHG